MVIGIAVAILFSTVMGYFLGAAHQRQPLRLLGSASDPGDPGGLGGLGGPSGPSGTNANVVACGNTKKSIGVIAGESALSLLDAIHIMHTDLQARRYFLSTTQTTTRLPLSSSSPPPSAERPSVEEFSQRLVKEFLQRLEHRHLIFILQIDTNGLEGLMPLLNIASETFQQELTHCLVSTPSVALYTQLLHSVHDIHQSGIYSSNIFHPLHLNLVEKHVPSPSAESSNNAPDAMSQLTYSEFVKHFIPTRSMLIQSTADIIDYVDDQDENNIHRRDIFLVILDGIVGQSGCKIVVTMKATDLPSFLIYYETECDDEQSQHARHFLTLQGYIIVTSGDGKIVAYRLREDKKIY